jgi:predicted nucleic acid-binding protein
MSVLFTIDASVFVASYRAQEIGSAISRDLLQLVREASVPLIEPAVLPVEIAAALAHAGEDSAWAIEFAESVMTFPYLSLQPLDERMARRAVAVAAQGRLRGADALYVTVAAQYGARLVTLDAEQLERAPATVGACNPEMAVRLLRAESRA